MIRPIADDAPRLQYTGRAGEDYASSREPRPSPHHRLDDLLDALDKRRATVVGSCRIGARRRAMPGMRKEGHCDIASTVRSLDLDCVDSCDLRMSAMARGELFSWIRADLRAAIRLGGSTPPGSGVGRDQRIIGRPVLFLASCASPSAVELPENPPIAACGDRTRFDGSRRGLRLRCVGAIANQPTIASGGTRATRWSVFFVVGGVFRRDTKRLRVG